MPDEDYPSSWGLNKNNKCPLYHGLPEDTCIEKVPYGSTSVRMRLLQKLRRSPNDEVFDPLNHLQNLITRISRIDAVRRIISQFEPSSNLFLVKK